MAIIRGTVTNANGAPVAGAAVYVVSAPVSMPDIAQLTGADGRFALGAPAPGLYRIGIRSDEAGSAVVDAIVHGETAVDVTARLGASPAPPSSQPDE